MCDGVARCPCAVCVPQIQRVNPANSSTPVDTVEASELDLALYGLAGASPSPAPSPVPSPAGVGVGGGCAQVVPLAVGGFLGGVSCLGGDCGTYGPAAAHDGNTSTWLRSEPGSASPFSLTLDFASPVTEVSAVVLTAGPEASEAMYLSVVVLGDAGMPLAPCGDSVSVFAAGDVVVVSCLPAPGLAYGVRITKLIRPGSEALGLAEVEVRRSGE